MTDRVQPILDAIAELEAEEQPPRQPWYVAFEEAKERGSIPRDGEYADWVLPDDSFDPDASSMSLAEREAARQREQTLLFRGLIARPDSRIRFWNADWELIWDSDTHTGTVAEFLAGHGDTINATVDFDGRRWAGRSARSFR